MIFLSAYLVGRLKIYVTEMLQYEVLLILEMVQKKVFLGVERIAATIL